MNYAAPSQNHRTKGICSLNIVKEFKEFAIKGNVIDLAVGVIIGTAFGKIVDSLVRHVIMPPLGILINQVDFKDLVIPIRHFRTQADLAQIEIGLFINNIVQFLIVAVAVFLLVKQINRLKRNPEKLPPTVRECPYCTSNISIKATRCPQCTSEIPPATTPENLRELHS